MAKKDKNFAFSIKSASDYQNKRGGDRIYRWGTDTLKIEPVSERTHFLKDRNVVGFQNHDDGVNQHRYKSGHVSVDTPADNMSDAVDKLNPHISRIMGTKQ